MEKYAISVTYIIAIRRGIINSG